MALLQAIRAQHQEALDKHFNEAIATRNYTKIVELLMDQDPVIPPMAVNLQRFLYLALSVENFPVVQEIIDSFVGKRLHGTVDYEDENNAGWGPLHLVVEDNNYDGATFLLENGADPDVETEDGTQPINISVDNKNVEMTKLLMSYGADSCGNKEAFKKAV
ncbi:B-cell lymphoma 3 protein homolog [Cotesia glomerata]|uniref:B-cell lymphoma 3 protein homolog n=1 Tax=Cotesia glomerata TaxID=32391 RepID=UPI001D0062F9|nr:B-cell lymphoma 3 protein homolog [Cotesia glomerata]